MKKLLLIAFAVMAFAACTDKNETPESEDLYPPTGSGKITFSGKTYSIDHAGQVFWGTERGSTSLSLSLGSEELDMILNLDMNAPDTTDKLATGTYTSMSTFADTHTPMMFNNSTVTLGNLMENRWELVEYAHVDGGTVRVAVSGETYTIAVDLTTDDDRTVTGSYTGRVSWVEGLESGE